MKVRGLAACAVVCVLAGVLGGVAAGTTKPPKHKPKHHVVKKQTAAQKAAKAAAAQKTLYDCAKYASAAQLTALAGGWGGTYTLTQHGWSPDRASYGPGGVSFCEFKPSIGYGNAVVALYYGTKNAKLSYAGTKQTATIRGKQGCDARAAAGNPAPTDPRVCGPVAIPGLGDEAFAVFSYIMVLRGPVSVMILLPAMPDPAGNLTPSQDLVVSIAQAIMARIPVRSA